MVFTTEDTMVDTTAILTDMELTDMPTMLLARGLLMPKLKLIPHTCTLVPMATLTLMVILMDTDTELSLLTMPPALATNTFPPLLPPMVSLNSTKDLLMPNLRLMLMQLSTMLVPTATLTLMVILMDMDTELLLPTMPPALATNTSPPLLPPMVSLNSTKDLLMPNQRLMLPLPTMVDTMAIPETDTMVSDTDMVVIMADMDTVVSATTVKL